MNKLVLHLIQNHQLLQFDERIQRNLLTNLLIQIQGAGVLVGGLEVEVGDSTGLRSQHDFEYFVNSTSKIIAVLDVQFSQGMRSIFLVVLLQLCLVLTAEKLNKRLVAVNFLHFQHLDVEVFVQQTVLAQSQQKIRLEITQILFRYQPHLPQLIPRTIPNFTAYFQTLKALV